jgi:hypothetical protein
MNNEVDHEKANHSVVPIALLVLCCALAAGTPFIYTLFPDYLYGYLIQIPALIVGYSYVVRYHLLEVYNSWVLRGVLLLSFAVPLQNTFLLKAARKLFLSDHLILEILRPTILLLIVLTIKTAATKGRIAVHWMVSASFVLGLAGWALATASSQYPALSIASGFFEVLCPFLVLYVVLGNAPDKEFLFHCIKLFIAAFVLITISQTVGTFKAIYSSQNLLGIPTYADEFLEIKKNLPLMTVIGENGYGNTDNYISLWTLIIPLIAAMYYFRKSLWWIITLYGLLYAGLLLYSRSGVIIIAIGFAIIFVYRATLTRKWSTMILCALALLLAINSPPSGVEYVSDGVISFLKSPKYAEAPLDASGADRMKAMRRGIEIISKHWFAGIGYGAYTKADPELTTPHNSLIQRFAEGGLLSFVSFLFLAAFPITSAINLIRSRSEDIFLLGCAVALGCFMVKASIFGATMSIGGQIAWGYAVALMLAGIKQGLPNISLRPNHHIIFSCQR